MVARMIHCTTPLKARARNSMRSDNASHRASCLSQWQMATRLAGLYSFRQICFSEGSVARLCMILLD